MIIKKGMLDWNILFSAIIVYKYFTVDFLCTYDMTKYPFDLQKCKAELEPKGNAGYFIHLVENGLEYNGEKELMQYQITNMTYIPKVRIVQ